MVEMNVFRSPNKEEYTRVIFQKDRGKRGYTPIGIDVPRLGPLWPDYGRKPRPKRTIASLITIESSYSSILPDVRSRGPETGPIVLESDEILKLRIFIDKSVVEVFANGKQCVAQRVYPGLKDSDGISLRAQGSEAELIAFDAWQMKSIYND